MLDLARDQQVPLAFPVAQPADETPVPVGRLDVAPFEFGVSGHHPVVRHRQLEEATLVPA